RGGAGTFVASSLPGRGRTKAQTRKYALTSAGKRPIARNAAALPPYERPSWAERLGPFQFGQPDLHKFPIEIWLKLVARYSRRMRVKALQYGDAMGLPHVREAIAAHVG